MISTDTPVDVICMINKTGKITPLKLRMEINDRILVSKVNGVLYSKENKYAGVATIDYGCKVEFDGIDQLIELRYYVAEHLWKINKVMWG